MSRTNASLDGSTKKSFDRAIHLFATNDDANNHNKCCLLSLNLSIARGIVTSLKMKTYIDANEENW